MKGSKRVLLVEDDAMLSRALARDFARAGFDVEVVARVADALAALEGDVDAVVTDVHLPDGVGDDVVRAAARRSPAPVVCAMSGDVTDAHARRLQDAGAAVVRKPFRAADLVALVARMLP